MPLPTRRKGEPREKFIERCMIDPVMQKEFPDPAQRYAVCRRQAEAEAETDRSDYLTLTAVPTLAAAEPVQGEDEKPRPRRFVMDAYTGGAMRVWGWRYPVVVDLTGLTVANGAKAYLQHDPLARVGHLEGVEITDGRLRVTGVISSTSQAAREVVADADNGYPWQASVGVAVQEVEFVKEGQTAVVNGREFAGPINVVRRAVLKEVSFVSLGADDQTSASIAAKAGETSAMDETKTTQVEQPTTEEPKKVEAAGGTEQVAPAGEAVQAGAPKIEAEALIEETRRRLAAEAKRIAEIRKVCAGRHPDIEARAIEEGWDVVRTELEVLRAERPKPPAVIVRDEEVTGKVLEAAVCLAGGLSDVEKAFDEPTLEAASRKFPRGISLQELLLEAAWANGWSGRSFRADTRGVLEAAFSTVEISGILSNVANKFLLAGFDSVEQAWRQIAATRPVKDFKQVTSYRLTGGGTFVEVGPDGELKHATLGEESYTNRAKTYGRMLTITRQDLINDDLGALTQAPRRLGRGAGLGLNRVFWSTFLDNATFFTAARGNYASGATTALSLDGLTQAEQMFLDQTGPDGHPIAVMPKILLVPTSLNVTATQLMKSTEIRDTTSGKKYGIANPHAGKFTVVVSTYLGNSQLAGYSTKAWYLLADPADLPVIEVAFLNGQQSPVIEQAEADFSVLGIQLRGYLDFGVALQEYRGGVKMKGEV